ncbi:MAG: hypothetical protein ACYCO5_10320 [Acidobacteriaceae bacterium]
MIAESFAELVTARRIGPGRWQAKCPAHADKRPSLAIAQGRDAVLLRCWSAGCSPESICAALGLGLRDLFSDADTTPAQRAQAAQRSRTHHAQAKAQHHAAIESNRELLRLERLRDSLGGLLARRPDDGEVSHLFNGVLDKLAYMAENAPEDGPSRWIPLPQSPTWIANELRQIFMPETPRQHDSNAVTFDELAAWLGIQNKKEKAASQAA